MSFLFPNPFNILVLVMSISFGLIFMKNKKILSSLLAVTFTVISIISFGDRPFKLIEIEKLQIIESVAFGLGLFLYLTLLLKRSFYRKGLEKVQNSVFMKLPLLGGMIFYAFSQNFSVAQVHIFYWGGFVLLFPLFIKLKNQTSLVRKYLIFVVFLSLSHFSRLFIDVDILVYNALITLSWLIGLFFLFRSSSELESLNEEEVV